MAGTEEIALVSVNTGATGLSALATEGFAALNRGDARAAREILARVVQAGAADATVWFALAGAFRQLGSSAEECHALDQALKADANYIPALIAKGDVFAKLGDGRAASAHYGVAAKLANSLPNLPTEWHADVDRIATVLQGMSSDFEAHLTSRLAGRGLGEPGTRRVSHAVELLLGKRQIFLQQPTNFYFPELPQIEFYDRHEFAWIKPLELQAPRIRTEVQAILGGPGWAPYIESEARRPTAHANPLLQNVNWSAFHLIKGGREIAANAQRCPATMAALRDLPLCRTNRTPDVLFSLLQPGTRIRPHHGFTNARLICHLPLIIPEECAIRVGGQTRAWHEAEVVVFDDSMEHEAWNLSKELRVVMIFDVWRPELSDKELSLVVAMLEAID